MIKIYGIKNCGTMKKAMAWLTENGIAFEFTDYKKAGIAGLTCPTGRREPAGKRCSTGAA